MSSKNGQAPAVRLEQPSRDTKPRIEVVRLRGGQRFTALILSPTWYGFRIHWDHIRKRSSQCTGAATGCPKCQVQMPTKEVWYLHCHNSERGNFFFESPPEAAGLFNDSLAPGTSLRGLRIEAYRTAKDNGRLRIAVLDHYSRRDDLPPAIDPELTLQALWAWGVQ
jgi:hypothetical protein